MPQRRFRQSFLGHRENPSSQILGPPVLKLHVASILGFGPEILVRSGDALKLRLFRTLRTVLF
jgi:hypothetical protein